MGRMFDELRYLRLNGEDHAIKMIQIGNKKLIHCYEALVVIGGMPADRYKNVYAILKPVATTGTSGSGAYFAEPGRLADFLVDKKLIRSDNPLLPALYNLAYEFEVEDEAGKLGRKSSLALIPTKTDHPKGIYIGDILIRQDAEGRYCLNDLHKAAGGLSKDQPGKWLENKKTVDLITEYQKTGIPVIQSKQGLGTFVSEDLVYDYAMWISAAFKVRVIQAYKALVNGQIQPAQHYQLPQNYKEAVKCLLESLEVNEVLQLENKQKDEVIQEQQPKVEFYDTVTQTSTTMSLNDVAKLLNFDIGGRNKLMDYLRDKEILTKSNTPFQKHIEAGYFKIAESGKNGFVTRHTVVYQSGIDYIRKQLLKDGYKPRVAKAA